MYLHYVTRNNACRRNRNHSHSVVCITCGLRGSV